MAEEIVRQIDHWIDDNPHNRGINWISALESGTRVISWILSLPVLRAGLPTGLRAEDAQVGGAATAFVEQHLSTGGFANTHLAGEAAALLAGGLFLPRADTVRGGFRHGAADPE